MVCFDEKTEVNNPFKLIVYINIIKCIKWSKIIKVNYSRSENKDLLKFVQLSK